MLFNSFQFLIFFPIVVLFYYVIPHRFRYIWLLVSSYYFYMCWNPGYALLLLGSTALTYFSGLLLSKISTEEKTSGKAKAIVAVCCILNLSILFVFKYLDFFMENLQKVFSVLHITINVPSFSLLLPVGISFYIFQALGYTIDVYRGTVKAEKNFLKYATFVSFFPQLVAGPIERAGNLLPQFDEKHSFDYTSVKDNLLLMGYGLFLKVVIADRIAIFVNAVYGDFYKYNGWFLVVATILFAFQIYCDFQGYSTIAIGAAGVMGFRLMKNFNSPYLATSVKDFWGRWHISLTGWFRDYLYIPLGGNRKGVIRKHINRIIVFLVSGFWHGAMWSFGIWGFLNGLFMTIGDILRPLKDKVCSVLKVKRDAFGDRLLRTIITFGLVDFTWIFFRAKGTTEAVIVLKQMLNLHNLSIFGDGSLYQLGLDKMNFNLMLFSILLLLIVDICHETGFHFREWLKTQNLWFRWLCYIVLIESIVVFGVWGSGYDASAFIYFQF